MVLTKIYDEGHADILTCHLFLDAWGRHLADIVGENFKTITAVFQNGGMSWHSNPGEQTRLGKMLLDRMLHEGLFEVVDRQTRYHLEKTLGLCDVLEKTDFAALSNPVLARLYEQYARQVVELNAWGMLVTLLEMGETSVITEATYAYLAERAKAKNAMEKVPEALSNLCAPSEGTYFRQKRVEEIRLAQEAKKRGFDDPEIQKDIRQLHARFAWVSYGYVGPALHVTDFQESVRQLATEPDLSDLLKKVEAEESETRRVHQQLESDFAFDDAGMRLFHLARTFMFQKEFRKQVLYRSFFALEPFRKEVAKRTGLSLADVGYLLPDEIPDALEGKIDGTSLRQRKELCVDLACENRVLVGKQAEEFISKLDVASASLDRNELSGQCANPGSLVKGVVRVVFNAHDLEKLKPGDILVSPATSPIMIAGMKIAGAIVTDQGGLTCHAAIVSRELGKPCVIGTKVATRVLKDGDVVEVDAIQGVVRKLMPKVDAANSSDRKLKG